MSSNSYFKSTCSVIACIAYTVHVPLDAMKCIHGHGSPEGERGPFASIDFGYVLLNVLNTYRLSF